MSRSTFASSDGRDAGAQGCQSQGSRNAKRPARIGRSQSTEVAEFSTPWAMAFLPGSGVPLTNMALLTEKEGKLWLVDVRNGQADGGVRRSERSWSPARAGLAMSCRIPISPETAGSI